VIEKGLTIKFENIQSPSESLSTVLDAEAPPSCSYLGSLLCASQSTGIADEAPLRARSTKEDPAYCAAGRTTH